MINSASTASRKITQSSTNAAVLAESLKLNSSAVVFTGNGQVAVDRLALKPLQDGDLVIDVDWSGVSTGTERLLWSGDMPPFPGLSYPLVPGYEAVGRVVHAEGPTDWVGAHVFVPGANCYEHAAGLFGASASRVVIPERRAVRLDGPGQGSDVLLALAATAHHAIARSGFPQLIIGHGVLGQLVARLTLALGGPAPIVWEINPARHQADGYTVLHPDDDTTRTYDRICDVSGDAAVLDTAIARASKGAEIVLAGFYADRVSFDFPAAFMREVTLKVAAEWDRPDIDAVMILRRKGLFSLDGLVTHIEQHGDAGRAYETAFSDAECLKMVLDWRACHDNAA